MGNIITIDGVDFESDFINTFTNTSPYITIQGRSVSYNGTLYSRGKRVDIFYDVADNVNETKIAYDLNKYGYCARVRSINSTYQLIIDYYDKYETTIPASITDGYLIYGSGASTQIGVPFTVNNLDKIYTYNRTTGGTSSYEIRCQRTYDGVADNLTYNKKAVHKYTIQYTLSNDNYNALYFGSYSYKYKSIGAHMMARVDGANKKFITSTTSTAGMRVKIDNSFKTIKSMWVKTDNAWKEIVSQSNTI